jgi:hypothetical protein
MFTPLDILYIVLAFCSLWLTAIIFWLIWQVASVIKRVNDTVSMLQATLDKMEVALDGIRSKFDSTSTALGAVVHTATKAVEYMVEKKMKSRPAKKTAAKPRSTRKKTAGS